VFLGSVEENEFYVGAILANVDDNDDGGIDLGEFTTIMMKVLITTKRNRK